MNEQLSPVFYLIILLSAIITFPARQSLRQWLLVASSLAAGAVFYPLWVTALAAVAIGIVYPLALFFAARRGASGLIWVAALLATAALFAARAHFASTDPKLVTLVGTSYFFLRALSLWFDAAKGKAGTVTFSGVLAYLLFFPTFVSGPIDRYARFSADVANPRPLDAATIDEALWRGVFGLFKKVVLADTIAFVCWPQDAAHCLPRVHAMTTGQSWLAFYGYAARIYLDFSGYTDVAIAVALLLGVRAPENFRAPYGSRNITEFWRRWHITLSEWLRDYIFLPTGIGLSRGIFKGQSLKAGGCAALFAFALCGLWHGATINFLIWGLLHGAWVFAHKLYGEFGRTRYPGWLAWSRANVAADALAILLTFHGVAFTWIWFSTPDTTAAFAVMRKMVGMES